jgi:hypothetical protein
MSDKHDDDDDGPHSCDEGEEQRHKLMDYLAKLKFDARAKRANSRAIAPVKSSGGKSGEGFCYHC